MGTHNMEIVYCILGSPCLVAYHLPAAERAKMRALTMWYSAVLGLACTGSFVGLYGTIPHSSWRYFLVSAD